MRFWKLNDMKEKMLTMSKSIIELNEKVQEDWGKGVSIVTSVKTIVSAVLILPNGTEFKGMGANKSEAKEDAAKTALRIIDAYGYKEAT